VSGEDVRLLRVRSRGVLANAVMRGIPAVSRLGF
jgi:hypothetical protein